MNRPFSAGVFFATVVATCIPLLGQAPPPPSIELETPVIGDPALMNPANEYLRATINPGGDLEIETADGRHISPKRERGQTAFRNAKISRDHRAIGWLNQFGVRGMPLQLVVYNRGFVRTFTGTFGILVAWNFESGARRIAFRSMFADTFDVQEDRLCDAFSGEVLARTQSHMTTHESRRAWQVRLDKDYRQTH